MEMETPLPPPVEPPSSSGEPVARTDGLAASLAPGASPPGHLAAGPEKSRGGRPPTHGRYSKAMGSNGKNPAKAPGPSPLGPPPPDLDAPPRVGLPPDMLIRVVKESLSLVENALANAIEGKARAAGLSAGEIAPQVQQARLGEARKQMVADLSPLVAEELGLDPQLSPSLAVCLVLAPWAFGSATAYLTLATLAKERALREKTKPKETPADERNKDHV